MYLIDLMHVKISSYTTHWKLEIDDLNLFIFLKLGEVVAAETNSGRWDFFFYCISDNQQSTPGTFFSYASIGPQYYSLIANGLII